MITSYQKTGSHHLDRGEPCQDRFCVREDDAHLVLALADGASACARSRTGARIASETGSEYVLRYGTQLTQCPPEKAAALLLEEVCYHLRRQAVEDERDISEYASTLLICRLNKNTGELLVFSLGDDTLFLLGEGKLIPAVTPRRRWGGCPLTVTEDASRAMTVRELRLAPKEMLMMCTDGFTGLFPQAGETLRESMRQCDFEQIKAAIDGMENKDDCSFLACGL